MVATEQRTETAIGKSEASASNASIKLHPVLGQLGDGDTLW